jgi:hypothetical protein
LWELAAGEENYCIQSARIAKTNMNSLTSKDYKLVLQIHGKYDDIGYQYKSAAPVNDECPPCDSESYTEQGSIGNMNQCLPSYQVTYNAGNQNQCFCIRGAGETKYTGPIRIYKTID